MIKIIKEKEWIVTNERSYVEPAIGECACGEEVRLEPDNEGLCYCYCGKCYNSAGQSIRPRSQWEERYEDDY